MSMVLLVVFSLIQLHTILYKRNAWVRDVGSSEGMQAKTTR